MTLPPPTGLPVGPRPWAASGPALLRAIAATVVVPALCLAVLAVDQPNLSDDTTGDLVTAGYWVGAVLALAMQALLLTALVVAERRRNDGRGEGVIAAAVVVWMLSALYIVAPILAIVVFLASLIASLAAGPAALLLCVAALVVSLQARAAGAAPGRGAAIMVQVAGWLVAVLVMPFAGGAVVLWVAGT